MANRFDPFRDLDRIAERMLSSASDLGQAMRAMPIDLYRDGDQWVLRCDLPGVDPASIDVDVDGRVMTIRAERTMGPDGVLTLTLPVAEAAKPRKIAVQPGPAAPVSITPGETA